MCIEIFQLRNQVAIVTGASRGLGKAMAMALAEVGASIVLVARNKERLYETTKEVSDLAVKTVPFEADVTKPEEVDALVAKTLEKFGKIDILVNNVGTFLGNPIVEFTLENYHTLISTNLTSTYLCSKAVGKHMIERQRGKVINMAAALGAFGANNSAAYCASKGGVIQLTKALAVEWAKYNINVNAIAPYSMETETTKAMLEDPTIKKAILGRIPLKRVGQPSDLAGVVIFLASQASDYVTGQTIFVDGGFSIQ